jgi:hypothetical protein
MKSPLAGLLEDAPAEPEQLANLAPSFQQKKGQQDIPPAQDQRCG